MEYLASIFIWSTVFLCALAGLLLIRFNRGRDLPSYMLAAFFFIMAWFGTIYILISSKALLRMPCLFRAGLPFYYLMPPLILLYSQLVIKGDNKVRIEVLLLHMAPFLVSLIDLFVYYSKHWHELSKMVQAIYQEPTALFFKGSGFIPAVFHYGFRPIQGCIYMLLTWVYLFQTCQNGKLKQLKKSHRDWLLILVMFMTIYYLNNAYYTFVNPLVNFVAISRTLVVASIFGISFCMVMSKLFFSPWLIYPVIYPERWQKGGGTKKGMVDDALQQLEKEKNGSNGSKQEEIAAENLIDEDTAKVGIVKAELLNAERVALLAAEMDRLMIEKQLFKCINRIYDLATYMNTSPRYISYVLSNHYQLRFNDFLNLFRIKFIIEEIKDGKSKNFTLESIASDAGFVSRSTFYTAFKKQTGLSPNQYLHHFRNAESRKEK